MLHLEFRTKCPAIIYTGFRACFHSQAVLRGHVSVWGGSEVHSSKLIQRPRHLVFTGICGYYYLVVEEHEEWETFSKFKPQLKCHSQLWLPARQHRVCHWCRSDVEPGTHEAF